MRFQLLTLLLVFLVVDGKPRSQKITGERAGSQGTDYFFDINGTARSAGQAAVEGAFTFLRNNPDRIRAFIRQIMGSAKEEAIAMLQEIGPQIFQLLFPKKK